MSVSDLRKIIVDNGNGVYFTCDGRKCGVEPNVKNSVFTFDAWYGTEMKTYTDFDEMVSDRFFGKKTIIEAMTIS